MKITSVKIRKITDAEKMKAIVSVTFDDALAVHDIKIIDNNGKLFISMPSKKSPEGEYRDIVHPINKETRDMIEEVIISKFLEATADAGGAEDHADGA